MPNYYQHNGTSYVHVSDYAAIEARLAEAERKLQLIAAHTGHNKFLADRELLSELLARIQRICNEAPTDSASVCWACNGRGIVRADGQAINCPECNPATPDQPNAARKTVWKPYDVFGVTGRLVYEDTGEDVPDQPGEAANGR